MARTHDYDLSTNQWTRPIPCFPGASYRIDLTLAQNGADVIGTIDLYNEPTVGPVSGRVDQAGHLVLQGTARNGEHQAVIQITSWNTFLDTTDQQMLGQWAADSTFANGFGLQHQLETYQMQDVARAQR